MIVIDIARNDLEIVRVEKREFKGHEFVDIRIYYQDESGEWKPTKKGVTINPDKIDELVEALKKEKEVIIEIEKKKE